MVFERFRFSKVVKGEVATTFEDREAKVSKIRKGYQFSEIQERIKREEAAAAEALAKKDAALAAKKALEAADREKHKALEASARRLAQSQDSGSET